MLSSRTRTQLSPGIIVLLYLGFGALMWTVRGWILAGTFQNVLLIVGVLAMLGITGVILGDWRNGMYFFLAWLLFEDLIRKYMGNALVVFFAKDVLVAVVYASFFKVTSREKVATFRPSFLLPLGLFLLLGMAQMFNPGSPSMLYGILGMKLYFYYVPLMFVAYSLLRNEEDLRRFLVITMALAVPVALVGIAQSAFGLDFLNPHAGPDLELLGHLTRETHAGAAVRRPPSVFVSDGRFDEYLVLIAIVGIGAAGYLLLRRGWGRKIVFPALALVALGAMLSGSRECAVWVGASALFLSAGMLWGAPPRARETYRLVKAIRRTFIAIALSLSMGMVLFPQSFGAHWQFYAETLDPRSPYYEVSDRTSYSANNFLLAFTDPDWLVGHGPGTESLGVQYVARLVGQDVDDSIGRYNLESGWATLIWEFGALGPILWVAWGLSFIYAAWRATMSV